MLESKLFNIVKTTTTPPTIAMRLVIKVWKGTASSEKEKKEKKEEKEEKNWNHECCQKKRTKREAKESATSTNIYIHLSLFFFLPLTMEC